MLWRAKEIYCYLLWPTLTYSYLLWPTIITSPASAVCLVLTSRSPARDIYHGHVGSGNVAKLGRIATASSHLSLLLRPTSLCSSSAPRAVLIVGFSLEIYPVILLHYCLLYWCQFALFLTFFSGFPTFTAHGAPLPWVQPRSASVPDDQDLIGPIYLYIMFHHHCIGSIRLLTDNFNIQFREQLEPWLGDES